MKVNNQVPQVWPETFLDRITTIPTLLSNGILAIVLNRDMSDITFASIDAPMENVGSSGWTSMVNKSATQRKE